jgi:4-amino-4-deoxy-L-arabinose transferase-like glycosyltransferase
MLFLALAIFLLAVIVRLLPLQQYHGWDESIYLQHAEHIVSGKSNYNELAFRPPLLPVLIAGGFRLWHSPYVASTIVALLGASITVALFLIGRRLHSSTAGIFAALLAAVHPLFVGYSHLVLTDALVASLLAFAILFALDDRWWAVLISGIFTGLAGLMKFTGFGAIVPLLLFVTYRAWKTGVSGRGAGRRTRAGWLRHVINPAAYCAGAAIAIAPYLLWAQLRYGSFTIIFERAQEIVNNVSGGPLFYLSLQLFTIPLLLGIALLVWQWRSVKEWKVLYAIFALSWLIIILGYINTFPNKDLRYALAPIVPLFILAGAGYAAALQKIRWQYAGAAAAAIILILSAGAFAQLQGPAVNHWKPAPVEIAERINALDSGSNTTMPIYATSDYPIYGYYTNNPVVVVDGPQFLKAYPRIMPRDGYLVINKGSLREPTVGWADSQEALTRIAENDQIVLYSYRRQAAK